MAEMSQEAAAALAEAESRDQAELAAESSAAAAAAATAEVDTGDEHYEPTITPESFEEAQQREAAELAVDLQAALAPTDEQYEPPVPALTIPAGLTATTEPDELGGQIATIGGKSYYIPGSTMYEMGYQTPEDYSRTGAMSDAPLSAAPNVVVGGVQVPKSALADYNQLPPQQQFTRMVAVGVIPKGSEYIAPDREGGGWRYQTPEMVERREQVARWERDVLPQMPEEYQEAYKAGDTRALQRLTSQYMVSQEEFDRWIEQEAPENFRQAYRERGLAGYQEEVAKQQTALQRLSSAGFVDKLPEGKYMKSADTPSFREYTIPAMAEFARKNPDGMEILRDAGFDERVLSDVSGWNEATGKVASYLDKGVQPTGTGLSKGLGLSSGEVSALGRAMSSLNIEPVSGSYVEAYRQLNDDQKRAVAVLFDKDWTKGNAFSALAADIESISSKNLALQLLTAPIQPITTPIGKQLTLPEAKKQLAQTYETELATLKDYVKPDGTFDVKKLDKADPQKLESIAKSIGYDSADELKAGLEYYNYGTRVSAKEWTMAGLVAALDIISLGAIGGASALATVPGKATASGVQLGLSALVAPDVIKTFKSPTATTGDKALGAGVLAALVVGGLSSIPLSGTMLARLSPIGRVKISEDIVATNPTVWKGVKIGSNPVIGISEGRPVIGIKGIRLPPLKEWKLPEAEGTPFEPRTGLEAKVLVNRTALERAGMTGEQAKKFTFDIEKTLGQVHKFVGKKSPNMNVDLLSKPIDTFSGEGVEAILRWSVKNKDIVDRIFGSSTMRPQFTKEALAEWVKVFGRSPGDVDILLKNVSSTQAETAVKDLVAFIRANSKDRPWVSADRPTLVENFSRSTGAKRHGIDVHFEGEPTLTGVKTTPSQFADMVYGMEKITPAVKVRLKGVGDVQVSRLSETGVGKTEQVLGWRRDPKTNDVILKTEAHRLKDYADLYEIIKTYNGKNAADRWAVETGVDRILAELSAKATGVPRLATLRAEVGKITDDISPDATVLASVAKRLKELQGDTVWSLFEKESSPLLAELQKAESTITQWLERVKPQKANATELVALKNSLKRLDNRLGELADKWKIGNEWVWSFSPSRGASLKSVGVYSPVVSISSIPLVSALRSPIVGVSSSGSPISVPSRISPSLSPSFESPKVAPSVVPSVIISPSEPSPVISPSVPGVPPSISVIASPEPPSGAPSPMPPSLVPSPTPKSTPSPTPPSPVPTPVPTPPSPYPLPEEPPKYPVPEKPLPPTTLIRLGTGVVGKESQREIPAGSIAWRQGLFWKYIPPPYDQPKPITLAKGIIPLGAIKTDLRAAKETIQKIGESDAVVPEKIAADLGVTDLFISDQAQSIDFAGGGEDTDVGKRIPAATQGMTVDEDDRVWDSETEETLRQFEQPARRVRRTTTSKPKRKTKRLTEWEYMTTLKGFRP